MLDTDHPQFVPLLDKCSEANQSLIDIDKEEGNDAVKFIQKLPQYFKMASGLISLYLLPAIETKYAWTEQT